MNVGRQPGRDLSALASVNPAVALRGRPVLTPRQLETLRYLAAGMSWREVMHTMGISRNTLRDNRRAILARAHAVSTPNAVWLLRHELEGQP